MKKLIYLLIGILSFNVYTQSSNLKGLWILERTVYENGKFLEINNPLYSTFLSFEFMNNSVKINDNYFDAVYYQDSLKVGFRNINYKFQEGYLLIQDKNDDKVSIYSKYEDYLDKHPEFLSEIKVIDKDTTLISNAVIKPSFDQKLTFEDYLRNNIGEYSKQQTKNILFKSSFILTKDNKIKDVKIIKGISDKFDKQFVEALFKAEKYFKNKTDRDIILEHKFNFVKMHEYYNSANARIFNDVHKKAKEYFQLNQFEKVITEYSKFDLDLLEDQKDRFQYEIWEAYLNLGISHLALNENEKACNAFNQIGDNKNFYVRNYLMDFCKN